MSGESLPLFDDARPLVPSSIKLRDYQEQMVKQAMSLKAGEAGLLVAATGLGKGEVAGTLMEQCDSALMIVPFKDLSRQMAQRLVNRGLEVGLEQAENRSDKNYTVACYKSAMRHGGEKFIGAFDTIIVDEVHLNYTEAHLSFLSKCRESGARLIGMTATPERSGHAVTDFYDKVLFEYRTRQATDDGWLVPGKVWLMVVESLDLSDFKVAYGGYGDLTPPSKHAPSLRDVLAREETVQCIASMIYQHYEGMPSVVFCAGIRQARRLVECLWDRGVRASIVHSKMSDAERRMHLREFEEGVTCVIINVGCLCVGYDFPPICKLFLCRPTVSKSRFTQMQGRATRALPGVVDGQPNAAARKRRIAASAKPFYEVFDITDTSRRCDLLSTVDAMLDGRDAEVVARVKRKTANATSASTQEELDEVADEEEKLLAAEREAALQLEIRSRGGVIGAGFGAYGRCQFAEAEGESKPKYRGWHIKWGKYKSWPLPDAVKKDWQWCEWHMSRLRPNDEAYASAIRRELRKQGHNV